MIIEMDMYSSIRRRYENGESIRYIASSLGISRQTVRKYCEGDTHPEVRKSYERQPAVITSDIADFIKSCFNSDAEEHLKKQKHTAKRIFDRLVDEKQFAGSYSSIRAAVGELKAEFSASPNTWFHWHMTQEKPPKLIGAKPPSILMA